VDQFQKIAAMRPNEADSPQLSLAKSMARSTIRRNGVEAAGPQIESALGMIPPPAPKVAATAPITIAAAAAASTASNHLSKRMPYQPAVISPQVSADPRVAAIAEAAIAATTKVPQDSLRAMFPDDYSPDPASDRSTETRHRRPLTGLAGMYAAVHGIGEEP
jgi:hypothetical protein